MIRLTAILIIVSSLFIFSCRHDTSELVEPADVNDLSFTDIGKDVYNHRDVNLSDLEEIRDLSEDTIDIEEDIAADGEDAGDTENLDDIFDVEDAGGEDIFDISDIIPDVACSNQCAKSGEKECYQYQNKWYVRECKDTNSDGCLEWENVAFCSYGCENGECKSCVPDCTNKECGDDGCGGSCGDCRTPPSNECQGNILYEYLPDGTCDSNFRCKYTYKPTTCQYGCSNGKCNNCQPACSGKNCGPDGCGGSCGQCISLEFCNINGICECKYTSCNGKCCNQYEKCYNGSCCSSSCLNKECGDDGCGGSCGSCNNVPADYCVNATTLRDYTGSSSCQSYQCVYAYNDITCPYGCANGQCKSCTPNCTNKQCGDDGCGGSCGSCNNVPADYCVNANTLRHYTGSSSCQSYQCVYAYNDITCPYGCANGQCKSCTPNCTNKQCGDDGCGGSCGSCGTNAICSNGSCACNSGYGNCDGSWSNGCEVNLTNNSNNCGSCGNSCGANATCNNSICVCTYIECNGACCDAEQVCFNNSCCTPNCAGKECGYDGCGGSCGDCGQNEQCKAGICQPINNP